MAEWVVLERLVAERNLRRARVIRDRTNPLEFPDHVFATNYRLPRHLVLEICDELRPILQNETQRGLPLPVETQVLVCLGFLATGSIQRVTGLDIHHQIHQSSVSRTIERVLSAFLAQLRRYITYPTSQDDLHNIKLGFSRIRGFPGLVGAIDGTHIPIMKPTTPDAHVYMNRKGFYSINVQIVCDSTFRILNIVASWPGSTHDSFIWANCSLREQLSTGRIPGANCLIGDSGYPLEPWLMTPILEPRDQAEEIYNLCHRSTRNLVERCIGRYKTTWRAMSHYGGTLLYSPEKVCKMAAVSAILHNICVKHRVPVPDVPINFAEHDALVQGVPVANVGIIADGAAINPDANLRAEGNRIRQDLIANLNGL